MVVMVPVGTVDVPAAHMFPPAAVDAAAMTEIAGVIAGVAEMTAAAAVAATMASTAMSERSATACCNQKCECVFADNAQRGLGN